ncbi:MAG: DUF1097 family protein [Candidatus Geothermincolales bacterium]
MLKRNAILAVALAVIAFFWIWFFEYLGARAYWVALVAFAVCMAYGFDLPRALPWMSIGAVIGPVLGILSYLLFMKVFPLFVGLSVAAAGAILVLVAGLLSLYKMREMLPMTLVGWGSFLGAVARYDYLIAEKAVEALPRAGFTLIGVMLSLLMGILIAMVLNALTMLAAAKGTGEMGAEGPRE